jgi:ubiquinone/menaquinone biosynthesis C-methylase UbiE
MSRLPGYLMEDEREAYRLERKVDAEAWVARFLPDPMDSVLEAGCGPGALLEAIAHRHHPARLYGVDISAARVSLAQERLARFNGRVFLSDARALPLDDQSIDLVYARFLLEYLDKREAAVREMVRVCAPGGTIMLQDLDGQLVNVYPEEPMLAADMEKVLASFQKTGFDPFVGRKLYTFLYRAGVRDIRVAVEPYHLVAGPFSDSQRALWKLKLDIARARIETVLASRTDQFIGDYLAWLDRPDTFYYSNLVTVSGTRP